MFGEPVSGDSGPAWAEKAARETGMSFGKELIESANEALAIAKGETEPAGAFVPDPPQKPLPRDETVLRERLKEDE